MFCLAEKAPDAPDDDTSPLAAGRHVAQTSRSRSRRNGNKDTRDASQLPVAGGAAEFEDFRPQPKAACVAPVADASHASHPVASVSAAEAPSAPAIILLSILCVLLLEVPAWMVLRHPIDPPGVGITSHQRRRHLGDGLRFRVTVYSDRKVRQTVRLHSLLCPFFRELRRMSQHGSWHVMLLSLLCLFFRQVPRSGQRSFCGCCGMCPMRH